MKTRLAAFLQVRPGEGRRVVLVSALFGLIEAGRGLGANAADALFFLRFGVEFLPYMFMLLGAANFIVSLSYAAGLGRFDKRRFYTTVVAGLALLLIVERASIGLNLPALYPALWITVNIVSSILGILVWNIAGDVCDARQAKRLFSLFVSAGILGGVIGNFITGPIAKALGTDNLLLLYAALLLLSAAVARQIARRFFRPAAHPAPGASFLSEIRSGYDFVRRSPLLILMAFAGVLFSILYFSIAFPFNQAVSAAFPGEAEVAGFLGVFSGIATAITFLASLFVANRLYARIGVVNAVLLLPITYLIGFLLFAANFSLNSAVAARLSQLVILGGVAGTAYSTLYNVVPSDRRGQVVSFDSGVPSQIGVALSGVLLILGERVLTPTQIFVMGMLVAVACGALVWRMRRAYGDALVAALRAGRFEVFAPGERAFAGFQGDANAIRIAVDALRDPKPSARRLSVEMLAQMRAVSAVPALVQSLTDADAEVRRAAIQALTELGARGEAEAIVPLLSDADPGVRVSALRALPELQLQPAPVFLSSIETLLNDADLSVRTQAAVALAQFGQPQRGLPMLEDLLRNASAEARALALVALDEIGAGFDTAPVVHALRDESALVRRAACHTLAQAYATAAIDALADGLADPDATVRAAAASALRMFGAKARPVALRVLQSENSRAQDAALDALTPNDPALFEPLLEYVRRVGEQARAGRELAAVLPQAGRATKLLREALEARAASGEQRLVKTVGLLGHREAMDLVGKSLNSRDAEARAAAVEALETLGNKQLARQIVPLLDTPSPAPGGALDAALGRLLAQPDGWLRALAASAIGELDARRLIPDLRALGADADLMTREAARGALAQMNEVEPMETLQTVSTMERILLLREVPLFADLPPDDLKQIAHIAREEWYHDGSAICREGEEGSRMFVLASGEVSVIKQTDAGEKLLATRRVGDFIGEMAIVESAPRSATMRAQGEVRTLVIDGNAFKAILRDRPEVSLAVLRGLSRRLREMMRQSQ